METLEQKQNREMAHILMVACLMSMLRTWRVKQEAYEQWEREEKKPKTKKRKPSHSDLLHSLAILLGMEDEI